MMSSFTTPPDAKKQRRDDNESDNVGDGGVMMPPAASVATLPTVSSSSISSLSAAASSANAETDCSNNDQIQWWRERSRHYKQQCERLQMEIDCRSRAHRGGMGKNKQTMYMTEQANMTNKTALMNGTEADIWPSFKFLFFRGRWTVYDEDNPHSFAAHVMRYVTLPQSFEGYAGQYYETFALPTVSSKLSSLRGNFVTTCHDMFKGE